MALSSAAGLPAYIRAAGSLGSTQLSQRSGVSRATQHRIDSGESDVTLGTLRELAIAAGLDVDVSFVPLSDPDAASAARFLLDPTARDIPLTRSVELWVTRLHRLTDAAQAGPIDIITEAGRASAPLFRSGAKLLHGSWDEMKLASAATAAGGKWAISGGTALARLSQTDINHRVPAILYVENPDQVVRFLSHMRPARPVTTDVAILPMPDIAAVDAWEDGLIHLVAPVQALIDSIGLGGAASETALSVARSW